MKLALGLIETKGLVGAIEAADAMVKAAQVKLIAKEKVTGAMINIQIVGEVAAVKSAVDAGAAAAQRVGELVSAHVIPRPDDQMDKIISFGTEKDEEIVEEPLEEAAEKPPVKELQSEAAETKTVETEIEDAEEVQTEIEDVKETELKTDIEEVSEIEEESETLIPDEVKESEQRLFSSEIPLQEELEKLNVHQLRHLARSFENFPIKGREISKANRGTLIDYFNSMR